MGRSLDALSFLEPERRLGGGSGGRFPLELLGMGGTGRREPRGVRMPAVVGGIVLRGVLGFACDEAVTSLGVVPDAPLTDELSQDGAHGLVPGCGALPDLALGEGGVSASASAWRMRRSGVSGRGAASPVSTWRSRSAGPLPSSASSISMSLRPGAARCSTVMRILSVSPAQVQIGVAPGVQLAASTQGLARPGGAALSCVVDQQHGGLEAALDIAQKAEDGGDLGDGVLVDAVQADQGVEDHEAGPDAFHRLHQALTVRAMIEAQRRDVDDRDVEGVEAGAGGAGDTLEAGTHDVACVLGGEQQDRAPAGRRRSGAGMARRRRRRRRGRARGRTCRTSARRRRCRPLGVPRARR